MALLHVVNWSLLHDQENGEPDPGGLADVIGQYTALSSADIIILHGVGATDWPAQKNGVPAKGAVVRGTTGDRGNRALDLACQSLQSGGRGTWVYLLLPNRNREETSRMSAVMWNKEKVTHTGLIRIPVDDGPGTKPLWEHTPHAMKFTLTVPPDQETGVPEQSLSVIPVHMCSNGNGIETGQDIRKREAAVLCGFLRMVCEELEENLLVIGRTNVVGRREAAVSCFSGHDLMDLNPGDIPTCHDSALGEMPFDRAFASRPGPRFRPSGQAVIRVSADTERGPNTPRNDMIKVCVNLDP